jgi:hypothetical protein
MTIIILWLLFYASASLARHEEMPQLDANSLEQHPFHYNMMVNTSADDAELDRYLWKGVRNDDAEATKTQGKVITYSLQSKVGKRAVRVSVTRPTKCVPIANNALCLQAMGPLIDIPCLFCGQKARQISNVALSQFTPDSMIQRMKWGATLGQCLFYGQRPASFKNHPDKTQRSLSRWTTDWGCLQTVRAEFFRTIWVGYSFFGLTCTNVPYTATVAL